MQPVWIVLVVAAIIAVFIVLMYNIRMRNAVGEAWNVISVLLKRGHDLIPNLVSATEAYMGFEQERLTDVIDARSQALTAQQAAAHEVGEKARAQTFSAPQGVTCWRWSRAIQS